jgi:hypothetical protein
MQLELMLPKPRPAAKQETGGSRSGATCSAGVDVTEAPSGYYPILKAVAAPKEGSNICRVCDWRKTCQDPATDFNLRGHRCMSYSRQDGHGVVFKSLPNAERTRGANNNQP